MRRLRLAAAALLPVLGACATLPAERSIDCARAPRPAIALSADGRTASTRIDVLTYNIEGLGWPARSGRAESLRAITHHLNALRRSGQAPDIVLFQEVYSRAAVEAVNTLDYPSIAAGPARSESRMRRPGPLLPGSRRPHRGEIGLKLATGGLAIAADYPVVEITSAPFPRGSCAGRDCLSNKGVLHAQLAIPGVPGTLHLATTHMNSGGASRVPARRHHAAHQEQSRFIARFLDEVASLDQPLIFGGDFNMRHSDIRFDAFDGAHSLEIVHRYCIRAETACDVRMSWDGDAPWMDTQDLQLFWSGRFVSVRPIEVEAMFDGGPSGPRLSDHDGFRVVYELSWPAQAAQPPPQPSCPA